MRYLDALLKAKEEGKQIVIPDIKVYSPKDGELLKGRSPKEYALMLEKAGAPVLSVVTEEKEFHGSMEMLRSIIGAVTIPVLRKDFIHTREDLQETKDCGASAILLMCSCLEPDELRYLYKEALAIGLDPFVETHVEEDFELVRELGAKFVGINNRDILMLEKDDGDVSHTVGLIGRAPQDAFLVTESSIKDPEEVRMAIRSGADAALVGTAIAVAPDPEVYYKMLTRKISVKICGNMDPEGAAVCVEEGVERIGFVAEYPIDVPWNLTAEEAVMVRQAVPAGFRACMITGGSTEHILKLAEQIRPDMIQVHYKENMEQMIEISAALKKMGIQVIRSLPVSPETCRAQYGSEDMLAVAEKLCGTDIAELLVDPRHGEDVGRKDLSVDEELFLSIKKVSSKPVTIAGGLNPDNLKEILLRTGADAIDIMNGSEDAPGRKNREKIRRIFEIVDAFQR